MKHLRLYLLVFAATACVQGPHLNHRGRYLGSPVPKVVPAPGCECGPGKILLHDK